MVEFFAWFNFSGTDWLIAGFCGVLMGMAKAGVAGTGLMIVPIMAHAFGGRVSTGIVLPMLITADIFAVRYYHRRAHWPYVVKVIPWAMLGVIIALTVGNQISEIMFRKIMSITVFCGITVMIWGDIRKSKRVPDNWWFAVVLGLTGGFASMIGNASGPVMAMKVRTLMRGSLDLRPVF